MDEFSDALEFLRGFRLQQGEVHLRALLDDGHTLQVSLTATASESILILRHSELGDLSFAPNQTTWLPTTGSRVTDTRAENHSMLDRLSSGLNPSIKWLTDALELGSVW